MTLPQDLGSYLAMAQPLFGGYDALTVLIAFVLLIAEFTTLFFALNACLFWRPGRGWNKRLLPPVSVLIPARNEELSIEAAIGSILSSRGVDLEVIVLDDGSTDHTAEIVRAIAEKNPRVRLETAPALPEGWNGKQHACWVLASLAGHEVFCFLDADVRVGPEAIYRMVSELNYVDKGKPDRALVSGFPRQETGTFLERLLLPLINFVLLCYLPMAGERWTSWNAFAAGCGQFMMVRKEPYFATGGHSANPTTMHDGLLLPKLFRRNGYRTNVYDLSRDAVCRMYRSAGEVWRGLAKNATEGMASLGRLPVFTVLLAVQIAPLPIAVIAFREKEQVVINAALFALMLGYAIRFFSVWRYRQSWQGALLHPLGVLVLLLLQWYAFLRKLFRRPAVWKERKYQVG